MGSFLDGKKKAIAAALASVLALIGLLNGLSVAEVAVVVGPLMIYIPSQGLADNGKEATKQRVKMLLRAETTDP